MARTFETINQGSLRWTEVDPSKVRRDDIVRVKDSGTVVDAITPAITTDPQVYVAFVDGTTSPVADVVPNGVKIGVTILHPDGGLSVIPLATP